MISTNKVYIGCSLDGFIADKNGGLEWLDMIPNPEGDDMGYTAFMNSVDALLMGRVTYETVCGFDVPWPYEKPVYVLSNSLKSISEEHKDKVFIINGALKDVLNSIHENGHFSLYIDGGTTIQNFLKEDLIDDLIITTIPILLGGGAPLFGNLENPIQFQLKETKVLLNDIVQRHYYRNR